MQDFEGDPDEMWPIQKSNQWLMEQQGEKWNQFREKLSPPKSMTTNVPHGYGNKRRDFGRGMVRSVSGQSLGDLESLQDAEENDVSVYRNTFSNSRLSNKYVPKLFLQRRSSETSTSGRRNFRSKRFSRNLERDFHYPANGRRGQSLHREDMDPNLWMDRAPTNGARRKNSLV
jgi:hypothetical protein